ncbi:hypothetical protein QEV61_04545 [Trueperella pyogenes]|uniref:hypothetical protein n=1 Tax=Trueperella pyogenes TaxID=1661 RepID=UPI0032474038
MNTAKWLKEIAGTTGGALSINAIAIKAGLPQATLNRHVNAGALTAEEVISICRAYLYPVTQGLVDLGFITEEDLKLPSIQATLRDATDEQLVDEIARRLEQGKREAFDQPIRPVDGRPVLSEVPDTMPPIEEMAANPHGLELEQGDHLED